jgi:hypothetical protein
LVPTERGTLSQYSAWPMEVRTRNKVTVEREYKGKNKRFSYRVIVITVKGSVTVPLLAPSPPKIFIKYTNAVFVVVFYRYLLKVGHIKTKFGL